MQSARWSSRSPSRKYIYIYSSSAMRLFRFECSLFTRRIESNIHLFKIVFIFTYAKLFVKRLNKFPAPNHVHDSANARIYIWWATRRWIVWITNVRNNWQNELFESSDSRFSSRDQKSFRSLLWEQFAADNRMAIASFRIYCVANRERSDLRHH